MKRNKWKWMGFLSAALLGTQCAVLPVSAMELPTVDAIPENVKDIILYTGKQAENKSEGEVQSGIEPCGVIFSYDGLQVPTPEELGLDASIARLLLVQNRRSRNCNRTNQTERCRLGMRYTD